MANQENFDKSIKSAKEYADSLDAVQKKLDKQEKVYGTIASAMGLAYGGFTKQIEKSNAQRRKENKYLEESKHSVKELKKLEGDRLKGILKVDGILKKSVDQASVFNDIKGKAVGLTEEQLGSMKSMEDVSSRISELKKGEHKDSSDEAMELAALTAMKGEFYTQESEANAKAHEELLMEINTNGLLRDVLEKKGINITDNLNLVSEVNDIMKDQEGIAATIAASDKAGLEDKREAAKISDKIIDSERELARAAKIAGEEMRNQEGTLEKMQGLYENNIDAVKKGLWGAMMDYDQAISDAGKDFGFVEAKAAGTAVQMASLNMEAARFGMNSGEVLQMMGDLGDELKTIDQKYLAESVGHFVAIQKATGISSQEVTTIAGEMMRAGKSSKDVENYMEGANKTAKMFGVNTKKILQGVSRNVDKMRQMGFQGGEESLTRMAARAERLNMNMDEMFDVADKARSIEGAMDMAAELQLAGGSFANIDPMSLLAAARKGPEELQKILTKMGGDIGDFNEKTGELKFDAIDADRLKMVADATGQTVDSIQKGLQKSAKTNQKLDLLGLSGAIGDDERNFLADLTKVGKDGKTIEMDPELEKLASSAGISLDGVDDLSDLNQEQITKLMEAKKADTASLEEQAEQNQSLNESFTALKDAFANIFTVFEPFIAGLTSVVQFFNGSTAGKWIAALLAFGLIAVPKLVKSFGKFKEGTSAISSSLKGMKGKKGILGKVKGAFSSAKPEPTQIGPQPLPKDSAPQGKGETGLQRLAKGFTDMGTDVGTILKGIGATALAGPALALMLLGMPTLFLMAGIGALGELVERGFGALGRGIGSLGNAKGIWKGLAVMALVGVALIPFAFAASLMAGIDWLGVLAGIGILALVILGLVGLGYMMMNPIFMIGLLVAVGVLIGVALGLLVFGVAMQQFARGAEMMKGLDFSFLSLLGEALWDATPGLILGGVGLLLAAPGLIYGSRGLVILGEAMKTLSSVDWAVMSTIGDSLKSMVPGLIGFGFAGLMFLNPIMLLGMLLMIGNLGLLALVMTPLATALSTGADGLDRFADGLAKLQAAANSLDLEKLESLKDLSIGMATAGAGGGMGAELSQIAEAIVKLSGGSGEGGKGGGTKKIQVDLKLNGRDLQTIIVDDTEIVS